MRKKILCMVCTAALLLQSLIVPATSYAGDLTTDEKANLLNQMYLLTGDGTSYQLDKALKRSEAAAFMVKALGVQNYVLQNKAMYSKTSFKDVVSSEWYAPYVGYCIQNGIITGFPDGTFKPSENLSEKAFFSMLLKALGYSSSDFTWDNINRKALEVGITKDVTYAFKTEDNSSYLRAGVVDSLYNALSLKVKNQEKVFVENLINNSLVSKDFAARVGLIKVDQTVTAIVGIANKDANTVEVTLNESVSPLTLSEVKIYKSNLTSSNLGIREVSQNGTKVTIKTDAPAPNQAYTVELTSVTDLEKNVVTGLKTSFTTKPIEEVKSAYFKISKIEAVNTKSINIYFTHPITDKAETELLYTLSLEDNPWLEGSYKNISVKKSPDVKNMVTLTLKELSFVEGKKYTVKVKGDMVSAYQSYLNQGDGEAMSFYAQSGVDLAADISNLYTQDSRYLIIDFSNKVDLDSAMNKANYTLREKDTGRLMVPFYAYTPKSSDRVGKQVVLRYDNFVNGKEYELTTKNVYNASKLVKVPDQLRVFAAGSIPTQEFIVEAAIATDRYTINLYFNKELTATAINNSMSIDNSLIVMKKTWSASEPRLLKLHLNASSPMVSGKAYKLTVYPGVTDFTEYVLGKTLTIDFAGTGNAKLDVAVSDATFIATDRILVKFNQPIDVIGNAVSDKFEVYHNDGKIDRLIIPESVTIVDETTAIVKLPLIMAGGSYQLRCKSIIDQSGQIISTLSGVNILNEYFK